MRIVAGSLGGRRFDSPGTSKTHPMSDKMRGALFNILGDIDGLTVLDAFSGSGALAFEALSRGAVSAILIEQDKVAQQAITVNIEALQVGQAAQLIRTSVGAWLRTSEGQLFDLVLCDPPYADPQPTLVMQLVDRLHTTGLLVLSLQASQDPPELPACELLDRRAYGDGSLAFYRKIQ
jgi:16S rRNA (guanine966-N2)-methyltransferase